MNQAEQSEPPASRRPSALLPLLWPPLKLYETAIRLRAALYESGYLKPHHLRAPVISVGNLTVGGTGKTPCVSFIARALRDEGRRVAILSRGYKRESQGRVEVSDGEAVLCGPREAGDEPYLLARQCPGVRVVVDADRYAAGRWLESTTEISTFILDDGYQHLQLARCFNLLLVDATDPTGGGALPPFGRLREPLRAMRRADAVMVTRSDQSFNQAEVERLVARYGRPQTPVFYAHHAVTGLLRLDCGKSERLAATAFARSPVAAVSGIARPERFIADLRRLRMDIVCRRDFADHHRYTPGEFAALLGEAQAAGAVAIVMTEKDAANLPDGVLQSPALPVYAAQIEFACREEERLKRLLSQAVT